jgi:hypothetical protein
LTTLQIVFNFGDSYGTTTPTPFYNQTWFASLVSLSVAVGVALLNNHFQKKNKRKEKDKQHADLTVYFFAQCENLLSSVGEQLHQLSELKKQIENNPYGGYELSLISSLNLDKIYALTPTQTFEIFVKEGEEEAKTMSEEDVKILRKAKSDSIIKIYRAFDLIETVKHIDAEVRAKFTTDNTLETTNYWETIYGLKLFKGRILLDREDKYFELGEKLHTIVWEFDTVPKRTIPEAQELVVEKMREVFKSKDNIRSPYLRNFQL